MEYLDPLLKNMHNPVGILILQLVVILAVTRAFSIICLKLSQPTVIGQIIAGIVLGPSLIGYYFPGYVSYLFAPESLKTLDLFSQLGLIFYMFMVGMEINPGTLKNRGSHAAAISTAGIVVPFVIGLIFASYLYYILVPISVPYTFFALFIGISMSITAFPVLARILQEREMTKSNIGSLVLTAAAVNDVTAWCLLASITAVVTSESQKGVLFSIVLAIIYIAIMLKIVRPFLLKATEPHLSDKKLHRTVVALIFIVLFASSYATHIIGLHPLFGAFVAGIIMPHDQFIRKNFTEKIADVSIVLLLPIFFVISGLRTQIELINNWNEWLICLMAIVAAMIGKLGGCAIASKIVGETWKDSLIIGSLMNTRGMMELIILNIGLDLKILTPEIFAILILMALITTFLTNPLLELVNRIYAAK